MHRHLLACVLLAGCVSARFDPADSGGFDSGSAAFDSGPDATPIDSGAPRDAGVRDAAASDGGSGDAGSDAGADADGGRGGCDTCGVLQVDADANLACAVLESTEVMCWGMGVSATERENEGALGNGSTAFSVAPVLVEVEASPPRRLMDAKQVSVAHTHACAVLHTGAVYCWGRGNEGQLGRGSPDDATRAVAVVSSAGPLDDITQVSTGSLTSCARSIDGGLWCWGFGGSGELGQGVARNEFRPVQVEDADGSPLTDVRSVQVGSAAVCAIRDGGCVWCWGSGNSGRLGNGSTAGALSPLPVQFGDSSPMCGVEGLSFTGGHACAYSSDGAWCWGYNRAGAIGDGTETDATRPLRVLTASGPLGPALAIVAGYTFTCALAEEARCWGSNAQGQLGVGDLEPRLFAADPVQTAGGFGLEFTQLALGQGFACGISRDGRLSCWGNRRLIGSERAEHQPNPVEVELP